MKGFTPKNGIKYVITIIIGVLMAIAILQLQGFSSAMGEADRLRILSNAFAIPAVMLIMLGCLVWLANAGSFDGLGYVLGYLADRLIPGVRGFKKDEKFYDYLQRKRNKEHTPFLFLIISGLALLCVAVGALIAFYRVWP